MSTRSYVGALDADARTYRVRYAHFDGDPDTMPYLIAAVWWHTFGCDSARTVAALLAHDWEQIGPDFTAHTPLSMSGYQTVPGVGMALPTADTSTDPITGQLTDPVGEYPIRWMYLFHAAEPGRLLICANTGEWTVRHRLDLTVGRNVVVG